MGTKRDLPYITKKIKKMMKLRKGRWNRAKKIEKAEDRCKYDEIQSAIESELEQEYHNYLESLFENSGNSTKIPLVLYQEQETRPDWHTNIETPEQIINHGNSKGRSISRPI